MATQPFLDATSGGSFATPAAWASLADAWEGSAFDAETTTEWVDAGIQDPATAALFVSRNLSHVEASLIRSYFPADQPAPRLADALVAAVVIKATLAGGASLSEQAIGSLLDSFFATVTTANITIGTK